MFTDCNIANAITDAANVEAASTSWNLDNFDLVWVLFDLQRR